MATKKGNQGEKKQSKSVSSSKGVKGSKKLNKRLNKMSARGRRFYYARRIS
jgi:hypothetical protein